MPTIPANPRIPFWLVPSNWLFKRFAQGIKTDDPAATLDRFFVSKHVKDLRAIILVTFFAVLVVFALGLALAFEHEWQKLAHPDPPKLAPTEITRDQALHLLAATLQTFFAFFGPVLAAFGVVVAWAYQSASNRLGVVDLFACEISTLCRVSTVLDVVPKFLDRLKDQGATDQGATEPTPPTRPAQSSEQFTSKEDYFPVFEHNTKDLQSLEANVVINITAFYTYMKAVRDAMRALPGTRPRERHGAARDVIYLLYLGFESGRHAIDDLVEFEPEQAEREIVVLISELVAYRFLREEFADPDDSRCKRLSLRETDYQQVIPDLGNLVQQGWAGQQSRDWEPARLLLPQLFDRYAKAMAAAKAVPAPAPKGVTAP